MPKIILTFPASNFDTDFMFSCASKFSIKTTPLIYFNGFRFVDVELESSDIHHLKEFCVKHKPECEKDFWDLVER